METRSRSVLEAALGLPDPDRAEIAGALLATLGPDGDDATEDELSAELDRRLDEALRDPSTTVPWSALKAER